ncbi:MAG TPA: hypothetical protein DEB39_15455 [Planctomycetaceae bacterium]|nr:hypothetical protein [Planctomycetaceae bacterium]
MKKVCLTLAAVVRDQEHYVREWLTFHEMIGVERFVIVLHKCCDHTESEIRRLPFFDEKVKLHRVVNDEQRVQMGVLRWMLDHYGDATEWMLFIDSDEFFFGTVENDLRPILSRYDKFSGVAAHWLMFGASNHVIRPPMPSIEHFTRRIPDGRFVHRGIKSAVKPRDVVDLLSPHLFVTKHGTVREDGDIVDPNGIWQARGVEPVWNVLRCNHYNTRSMEDWVARRKRGSCNDFRLAASYDVDHFYRYNNETVEDLTIRRFVPELEERLRR